jgi:hypothetical protein
MAMQNLIKNNCPSQFKTSQLLYSYFLEKISQLIEPLPGGNWIFFMLRLDREKDPGRQIQLT